MPDNAPLMNALTNLHDCLRTELAAGRALLARTKALRDVLLHDASTDAAIEQVLEQHGKAFTAAQEAEEATRHARFRVQEAIPMQKWQWDDLETHLKTSLPESEHENLQAALLRLRAVAGDIQLLLSELTKMTAEVMEQLNEKMAVVGRQARDMAHGRQAADAYHASNGGQTARFIDKRE